MAPARHALLTAWNVNLNYSDLVRTVSLNVQNTPLDT
jgi:hypothetical protein